jgi:hypothetical protein
VPQFVPQKFERMSPVRRTTKTARWTKQVVLKRRHGITILRCGKSQKSADSIYIAAEAWNRAAVSVRPSEYSAHLIIIGTKLISVIKFHRNDSRVRTTLHSQSVYFWRYGALKKYVFHTSVYLTAWNRNSSFSL